MCLRCVSVCVCVLACGAYADACDPFDVRFVSEAFQLHQPATAKLQIRLAPKARRIRIRRIESGPAHVSTASENFPTAAAGC